jgi:hypothetical protein
MKRPRQIVENITAYFIDKLEKANVENADFVITKSEIAEFCETHDFDTICRSILDAIRKTNTPCVKQYDPNVDISLLVKQVDDASQHLLQSSSWTYRNTTTIFSEKTRLLTCSTMSQRLSTYLTGDVRYREKISKIDSAQQSWDNDNIMLSILLNVLKFATANHTVKRSRLRANILLFGNCQYPTSFPIPIVLYILRREAARKQEKRLNAFLDPCAGWGDRLAGALISGPSIVERYIGIDPWSTSHMVCRRILDKFGVKNGQTVELWKQTAQTTNVNPWPDVDLVFTSPPYAELECYGYDTSETNEQAWKLCAENKFMMEFLIPLMKNSARATQARNGRVIINICNTTKTKKGATLTEDLVRAAKLAGLTLVEIMGMATGNRKKSQNGVVQAEPIFIFQN